MTRIPTVLAVLLALCLAASPRPAGAATIDPHALFEASCGGCHGHAGDFAREALVLSDGAVTIRRSGTPVRRFLLRHRGGLDDAGARALAGLFRRQLRTGALFRDRCAVCHGRAREFVRLELTLEDGRLTGRYSGRDAASFLAGHGRLTAAEARTIRDVLTEHAETLP
jgi:mono/diheme cytochrome c family protein